MGIGESLWEYLLIGLLISGLLSFLLTKYPHLLSKSLNNLEKPPAIFTVIISSLFVPLMVVLYFRDLEIHETFMLCILFFILIASAFTDYLYRIIPNRLLLAGFLAWLIISGLSSYKPIDGLLAGFVIGLFFWIIATFYLRFTDKEALGMGDIKLFFITGLLVGWTGLWLIYLSVLFGALYAAAGILTNRFDRNHRIPIAPFLAAGSFLGIFVMPWDFIMDFLYAL